MAALLPPTQAIQVIEFVKSVGVGVGFYYTADVAPGNAYNSDQRIIDALNYSLISRVRFSLAGTYMQPRITTVYNAVHVKYDPFLCTGWGATLDDQVAWITANRDEIETVENANEVDNWPVTYHGQTGYAAAIAQQQQFFADMQPLGIPVISTSLGNPANAGNLGDLAPYATYAVSHDYPPNGQQPGAWIPGWTTRSDAWTPNAFTIQTEAGYSTPPSAIGVSFAAQAKLTLNLLLDSYKDNIYRTYIFELFDEYDGSTTRDYASGIFYFDGTPKPSATAIHNMLNWLGTTGADTITPSNVANQSLAYSVSNLNYGQSLLMQRGDGTFVLAVWAEPNIANNEADIEAPTQTAQIDLDASTNATIYDPITDTTTQQTGSRLQVAITDHPVFIQLGGTPPASAAEIATAAQVTADGMATASANAPAAATAPTAASAPTGAAAASPPCVTAAGGGGTNGGTGTSTASSPGGPQLGVYVGNPNNADATEQAATVSAISGFTAAMGQAPTVMNTYVDQSIPASQWAGNAGWDAASWAATPALANVTPVVAIPMAQPGDSADADFQAIASGAWDSLLHRHLPGVGVSRLHDDRRPLWVGNERQLGAMVGHGEQRSRLRRRIPAPGVAGAQLLRGEDQRRLEPERGRHGPAGQQLLPWQRVGGHHRPRHLRIADQYRHQPDGYLRKRDQPDPSVGAGHGAGRRKAVRPARNRRVRQHLPD